MVEPTAVHGPQLTAHALLFQVFVFGRREAAVEEHEVERRANPGDGGDDVDPAQQQVGPVEKVAFHISTLMARQRHIERVCDLAGDRVGAQSG